MLPPFSKVSSPFCAITDEPDENGRMIYVYRFDGGVEIAGEYPNVVLRTAETECNPIFERTMSLMRAPVGPPPPAALPDTFAVEADPLFFFIYNTSNYFHFLYDSLPYLVSYFRLRETVPNLRLLISARPTPCRDRHYPFVLETLQLLGLGKGETEWLPTEGRRFAGPVFVSTSWTHDKDSNLPPRREMFDLYRRLVELAGPAIAPTPPKIYVSRRSWIHGDASNLGTNYTTRRLCMNEDQLVEHLIKQGYVEVFPETMTMREKIQLFAGATHVKGAIGGGVANVLFSPSTTRLEVFVSPTFLDINRRFCFCLSRVNVEYNLQTEHVENGRWKRFMRVVGQRKDGGFAAAGEIMEIAADGICVAVAPAEGHTGWDAAGVYKTEFWNETEWDITALDAGLNSAWRLLDPCDTA